MGAEYGDAQRPLRVLVVDDCADLLKALTRAFKGHDVDLRCAIDVPTGLEMAATEPPDLAIVDLWMPEMNGFDFLREVRVSCPSTVLVVCSANITLADAVAAGAAGAHAALQKPASISTMLDTYKTVRAGQAVPRERPKYEPRAVEEMLKACDGNVALTARALGMHRKQLQRIAKENGASNPRRDTPEE